MFSTQLKFSAMEALLLFVLIFFPSILLQANIFSSPKAHYLSTGGSDKNEGTKAMPWRTIEKVNSYRIKPGDSILFEGGKTFYGSIKIDSTQLGTAKDPILISSYKSGWATIQAGQGNALDLSNTSHILVKRLILHGDGRKNGNHECGLIVNNCKYTHLDSIDISGFQKVGLLVYGSQYMEITHLFSHDNGAAGISVEAPYKTRNSFQIHIAYCRAEDNPGDPTNLVNHSGNGIVVGHCSKVLIEYCTATNNGWDMPRKGNGPVGIWCYEADSVIIQHCISYRNKTSVGSDDGGGFDLDGGVKHSIIQYCLSYENQGSAFGIFQYDGASQWSDNTIRYNISENDGAISTAHSSIYIWNNSKESAQFANCLFYNNIIYNTKGVAIHYSDESNRKSFKFYNNIFVAQDSLITGKMENDCFVGNDWWCISTQFNMDGNNDFVNWALKGRKELINGEIIGYNIDPQFSDPAHSMVVDPQKLKQFINYKSIGSSPLQNGGVNLKVILGIDTGDINFNGKSILQNSIGACF